MPNPAGHVGTHTPDQEQISVVHRSLTRIQARIERDLTRVERAISTLFDRDLEPTEILEALEICDALGSKFGMLGFGVSAELMRRTASMLDGADLGVASGVAMASMLEDARMAMVAAIEDASATRPSVASIVLVGSESATLDDVVWVASTQGMSVHHIASGVESESHAAAAVIVVAEHPDLARMRPVVRGLRERYPTEPFVLLTPPGTLAERAPVVDLVTTIMPRSVPPAEVAMETRRAIVRSQYGRTVSVLGDQADWVAKELNSFGLVARAEHSAEDLMTSLQTGSSRAALLLPVETGPSPDTVLRAIRSDRALRPAVVAVVNERSDVAALHHTLRDGADSVFPTDVELGDVVVQMKAALERRANLEPVADPDARHGAIPWANASVLIERLLTLSFRRNLPMGLAVIRLPVDVGDNDLDERIAREFRADDVIARRSDDRLVIALQGVGRRTLLKRLADLHRKYGLDEFAVRSAGVEFPSDGRSLPELIQRADETLDRVEEQGGPTIAGSEWVPDADQATDILIVDPDTTLGAVLVPLLERRGWRVDYQPDALKALDLLTGHSKQPLPSLVLLELDLVGVDGLQFLRQIREAGTASRFNVIILSSRTAETDLRHAFELGAEDFVSKPFSTPLLLHRVQRTLDRR